MIPYKRRTITFYHATIPLSGCRAFFPLSSRSSMLALAQGVNTLPGRALRTNNRCIDSNPKFYARQIAPGDRSERNAKIEALQLLPLKFHFVRSAIVMCLFCGFFLRPQRLIVLFCRSGFPGNQRSKSRMVYCRRGLDKKICKAITVVRRRVDVRVAFRSNFFPSAALKLTTVVRAGM